MNDEAFIDTNIWVYAHLESPVDDRWRVARELTESRTSFTVSLSATGYAPIANVSP